MTETSKQQAASDTERYAKVLAGFFAAIGMPAPAPVHGVTSIEVESFPVHMRLLHEPGEQALVGLYITLCEVPEHAVHRCAQWLLDVNLQIGALRIGAIGMSPELPFLMFSTSVPLRPELDGNAFGELLADLLAPMQAHRAALARALNAPTAPGLGPQIPV